MFPTAFAFSFIFCLVSNPPAVFSGGLQRDLRNHRPFVQGSREQYFVKEREDLEYDMDEEQLEIELIPQARQEKHPCQRTCEENSPMTCRYNFVIEYFSTMSKACFECPYNASHCSLPQCIAADGVKRTIITINRQLPGPPIEVCLGDTIEVEVKNEMLDVSTSIHWHGIFQKETPFMDGVPFVSQCLISPFADFLYRFYADNPGTHLWHSHSAVQRGDGMFGPLIVKVPQSQDPHVDLYDYDLPEHVVTILDWEHVLSVQKFVSHYHAAGDNKPPTILVNGKGRFQEFRDEDEIIFTPAEKFTVTKGFRYRFRIINAGFLNCPIEVSVDDHNMTVIASDGGDLEPTVTETLVTVAGERFDVIIDAQEEVKNYWIRFKGILDCSVKKAFQVAILHYEGADEEADPEEEATYDTSQREGLKVNSVNMAIGEENSLLVSELPSLLQENPEDPTLKPEADVKFYIPYDFYPVENIHYLYPSSYGFYKTPKSQRAYTPQINHISMQFPNFPLMANIDHAQRLEYCNGSSISMECRFNFCECPHVLQVPLNAVVEFILIDEGQPYDANHPFHLHGYSFRVVGMDRLGSSVTEEEVRRLDQEGLLKRNLKNPPLKDTVTVPDGGYTILRFHATNPGFWILHCHLDFHVEMGMALLFQVGEPSTYKQPPENFPMCGDPFNPRPINGSVFARFFPRETEQGTARNKGQAMKSSSASALASLSLNFMFISAFFHHFRQHLFVCVPSFWLFLK